MLGGGVARAAGIDLDACDRADHDDVASLAPLERRQESLRHALDAEHVRLEHLAPLLLVRLGDGLEAQRAARRVDDDVDLGQRFGERGDRRGIRHVELDRIAADLGGELAAALDAARGGDRVEAGAGQSANRRRADAARSARDERDPARARSIPASQRGDLRRRRTCQDGRVTETDETTDDAERRRPPRTSEVAETDGEEDLDGPTADRGRARRFARRCRATRASATIRSRPPARRDRSSSAAGSPRPRPRSRASCARPGSPRSRSGTRSAQGAGRIPVKADLTILFTDLVEFSNWSMKAGDAAAVELLRKVSQAIEPPVGENTGKVVKRLGDGMMAVFASSADALAAVTDAQDRLKEIEVAGYRPVLRAGMHVGRPERVGDDYFGVDVNIAARVAEAASGGEILATDKVLDDLDADSVKAKRKRMFRAKGVPTEIKVYSIRPAD